MKTFAAKRTAFATGALTTSLWVKCPDFLAADLTISRQWLARSGPYLPYGRGRSYGDCCLSPTATLIDTQFLQRWLYFDPQKATIGCESGMTLGEILQVVVPHGFILPVLPGHQDVTVGGAIAADVHGKNHVAMGSFGHYVESIDLWRFGEPMQQISNTVCPDLFAATIGGLGLTGVIGAATLRLIPIAQAHLTVETLFFTGVKEYLQLELQSQSYAYRAAWLDGSGAHGNPAVYGAGIFFRAQHLLPAGNDQLTYLRQKSLKIPKNIPVRLLNTAIMKTYNRWYHAKHYINTYFAKSAKSSFADFFFQLDNIDNWNQLYGPYGFYQYQCVISYDVCVDAVVAMLQCSTSYRQSANLIVLKAMGKKPNCGLLSFAQEGITIALDFSPTPAIAAMFDAFDQIVVAAKGRIYPVKDRRMSAKVFWQTYSQASFFQRFRCPHVHSSFAERVEL